jgi:4-carboxymuconolactone decarboxylase
MSFAIVLTGLNMNVLAQQNAPTAGASIVLPKDVYPDSGFRLPLPKRENFDDAGRKAFDMVVNPNTRTLAGLQGPLGIQMYSPRVAVLEHELNDYLRYQAGFDGRVRELAILITAREENSQFEWNIHERVARKEGLDQKIIDVVKYRKNNEGLPEREAVVIQLGREMLGRKNVTPETFARALKQFGPRGLVDLVSLMANYSSKAELLRAFDATNTQPGPQLLMPLP